MQLSQSSYKYAETSELISFMDIHVYKFYYTHFRQKCDSSSQSKFDEALFSDIYIYICAVCAFYVWNKDEKYSNLYSEARRSRGTLQRRIRLTFEIFWPSDESLNDKSESWCFVV